MSEDEYPVGSTWRDRHGDVWTQLADGRMETPETALFSREHVEKKWGPLERVWSRQEIELIQLRAHQDWLRIQPFTDPPDPTFLEHDAETCKKCRKIGEVGV